MYANVNWEELGFSLNPADYMFVAKSSTDGGFSGGTVTRYGPISLDPAAGILNFGQVGSSYAFIVSSTMQISFIC